MKNIFTRLRHWLFAPRAVVATDPTADLSARDWADLPTYHPSDECMPSRL